MLTDSLAYIPILKHDRGADFNQRNFLDENLVVGQNTALQHIDFLFNLLADFLNLVLLAIGSYGVFVNSLYGRSRNVQTLDVDLLACKYRGYLTKDTRSVLGVYNKGI